MKLFKTKRPPMVEFDERRGSVCNATCRRNAILDQSYQHAFLQGVRRT